MELFGFLVVEGVGCWRGFHCAIGQVFYTERVAEMMSNELWTMHMEAGACYTFTSGYLVDLVNWGQSTGLGEDVVRICG